jgi:hypothetical protein
MYPQIKEVTAPTTNATTVQILKPSHAKITEPNNIRKTEIYLYSSFKNA